MKKELTDLFKNSEISEAQNFNSIKITLASPEKIKSLIKEGDRCLILSENRPYWLIADLAVMNAGGISVPIFTTYSSNDYEYILNDCKPSLIIVSNNDQFKKIKKHINFNEQKIISFEEIEVESLLIKNILNENFSKYSIINHKKEEHKEKIF